MGSSPQVGAGLSPVAGVGYVTFSVCCRVLCNSQQLEVFPAVMTAALGRHCRFVEKIRGGI